MEAFQHFPDGTSSHIALKSNRDSVFYPRLTEGKKVFSPAALFIEHYRHVCNHSEDLCKVWLPQNLCPHLPHMWLWVNSAVVLLLEAKLKG